MLYDPCAETVLVNRLRKLVTGCFRKHVITPFTLLTRERVSILALTQLGLPSAVWSLSLIVRIIMFSACLSFQHS